MAQFKQGNKYGNRFTRSNQPKKKGRKPTLYKSLKQIVGEAVDSELNDDDFWKIIRWTIEQNPRTLEKLIKNPDGSINTETPLWLISIIEAINRDIKYGRMRTINMIFDRIFGKATVVVENEIAAQVNTQINPNSLDLSTLTEAELLQFERLLDKISNPNYKEQTMEQNTDPSTDQSLK